MLYASYMTKMYWWLSANTLPFYRCSVRRDVGKIPCRPLPWETKVSWWSLKSLTRRFHRDWRLLPENINTFLINYPLFFSFNQLENYITFPPHQQLVTMETMVCINQKHVLLRKVIRSVWPIRLQYSDRILTLIHLRRTWTCFLSRWKVINAETPC